MSGVNVTEKMIMAAQLACNHIRYGLSDNEMRCALEAALSALTDEARAALSPQMAEACESTFKHWRERALKAEAENERLRGYLTRIACFSQDTDLRWWHVQARAALAQEGK